MAHPAPWTFRITRGDTFADVFNLKDSDGNVVTLVTNGSTAKFTIKDAIDGTQLYQATSAGGTITLADTKWNVTMAVPSADTRGTLFTAANFENAVADLQIITGTAVETWVKGPCELELDVTTS